MKNFITAITMVLFALILNGCRGKDDKNSKEECDKKGSGWVWDVSKEDCVAKATTKEECDKKGSGWTWDEAGKKCNQVTAGLSLKEKCEAKGAGWFWDEAGKKCNQNTAGLSLKEKCEAKGAGWFWDADKFTNQGKEYKKCNKDVANNCTDPAKPKPLMRNASFVECVAAHYTVINSTSHTVTVMIGFDGFEIDGNGCRAYHEKDLRLSWPVTIDLPNPVYLCYSPDGDCLSAKGNYEVQLGSTNFVMKKVDKTVKELREMGCFRRLISARGPL